MHLAETYSSIYEIFIAARLAIEYMHIPILKNVIGSNSDIEELRMEFTILSEEKTDIF